MNSRHKKQARHEPVFPASEMRRNRGLLRNNVRRELWTQLPPDDLTCPRDKLILGKSRDLLFQFRMITHRERGYNRIAIFQDDRRMIYLLMGEQGVFAHPMTGLPVEPDIKWKPAGTLKMGTVEKQAQRFWDFRAFGKILGTDPCDFTLCVDGIRLSYDGEIDEAGVAKVKERWSDWALGGGEDGVCDRFKELRFMEVGTWKKSRLDRDVLFCPLDGPVKFIVGELHSPSWTWRQRCGRLDVFALCPKCLGVFGETLSSIN